MQKLPILPALVFSVASCQPDPLSPIAVEQKMMSLQEHFDEIDRDGDDHLTKSEIIGGYETIGIVNRTPETADAIIAFYDFNRDQKITLREAQSGAVTGADELVRRYRAGELNR